MMAQRMLITARVPVKPERKAPAGRRGLEVAVALGDPRLPDPVKKGGRFNEEDLATVQRLKDALAGLDGLSFRYLDNHDSFQVDLAAAPTDLVLNLCDEGWRNDPFMELHVTALLEMHGLPYTGAGPACLAQCYDKALVRLAAQALDIPVPMETYVRPDDMSATLPSVFPALLKPNFGDSSVGITRDAVVRNSQELVAYLERLRETFGGKPVLVQEFLSGGEYTVGLIGNPRTGLRALPLLEVDYSGLPEDLPRILGYESKWLPDSPYWTDIRYRQTTLPAEQQAELVDHASRLFERLGCRDYARFDFRAGADGAIKLLEANPNPGWCWDGKFNLMAEFAGMTYGQLLEAILNAAVDRLGLERPRPRSGAMNRATATLQ
jgi:D-alanine-D-alanine ligase